MGTNYPLLTAQMESSQDSVPMSSQATPPPGFMTIDQVQNLPNARIMFGANKNVEPINIIGFLQDFQPPRQTGGTDWKCCLEIIDSSVSGRHGIKIHIFRAEDKMPRVYGAGDIILARKVKPQLRDGFVSVMANFSSEFHILPASKIPTALSGPLGSAWQSYPPSKCTRPTAMETSYAIQANGNFEELALPTSAEFAEKSFQAMKVNDKFSLLKDVQPGRFYDILGEVIQVHEGDRATVYLSDYTANSMFYDHVQGQGRASDGRDGDEHNYLKPRKKVVENKWPGPHGKMSIQLTLFDGHAAFVTKHVKANDWVLLRNVQMKYGNNGNHLEGFLRGDQYRFEGKVQVEIMEQSEEPHENDSRWKEGVNRKYQYGKKVEQQKQKESEEAAGLKRKREDKSSKSNNKSRRKEKRAAALRKAAATDSKNAEKLDLNQHIRSSNPDEATVLLTEILRAPSILTQPESGRVAVSPFHLCNYKANVRVVDYFPPNVEDFAVGRRSSEFDMLSDYSGGEDTDPEEEMRVYKSGKGFPEKTWEWRFALQVVDANAKASTHRMWLLVGNYDAQMLLNMDAKNLRKDPNSLQNLKEQLCVLWGDLEEQKSALMRPKSIEAMVAPPKQPSLSAPPIHRPGDQPPTDSDDEDESQRRQVGPQPESASANILSERDVNARLTAPSTFEVKKDTSTSLQIKNKAFTCCIKQYGVKVKEKDATLANAGDGKRWERRFGLFGTQIM